MAEQLCQCEVKGSVSIQQIGQQITLANRGHLKDCSREVRTDQSKMTMLWLTVAFSTPIEYKGTDYLQVDLSTRLIFNVTSSSDLLNYYIQLGDDVIKSHES